MVVKKEPTASPFTFARSALASHGAPLSRVGDPSLILRILRHQEAHASPDWERQRNGNRGGDRDGGVEQAASVSWGSPLNESLRKHQDFRGGVDDGVRTRDFRSHSPA